MMMQNQCEHEWLVVASARAGIWPVGLENHLATCAICAETKRVAQLFQQHAAAMSAQSHPPAANIVWQKAQAHRQQLALKRATRCMAWMWASAAVYAIVLTAWYLPQLWHMQPSQFFLPLSPLESGRVFAGVSTAVAAVAVGACCLVVLGSRTTFRLHSE
jgi:hypothetical protein